MLNNFTKWELALFILGLLLTTTVPFLINGRYLPIPDFWGGFLGGVGIGILIAIIMRVRKRKGTKMN
jgi:hypothetical protein